MFNIEPERVYIGLPQNLDVFWVAREFRTNPLSHITIPGIPDVDVVVELQDGRAFGYDLIKFPYKYIRTFFFGNIEIASTSNSPVHDYVALFLSRNTQFGNKDFGRIPRLTQIDLVKQIISRIFVRTFENEEEREKNSFEEVWNAETSFNLPWDSNRDTYTDDEILYDVHQPQGIYEYYGYDMNPWDEDPVEKAERLWGIPDPRLVED